METPFYARVYPSRKASGKFYLDPFDSDDLYHHFYPDRSWKNIWPGYCEVTSTHSPADYLTFCRGRMLLYEYGDPVYLEVRMSYWSERFPRIPFQAVHYENTSRGNLIGIVANRHDLVELFGVVLADQYLLMVLSPDELPMEQFHCKEESEGIYPIYSPLAKKLASYGGTFRMRNIGYSKSRDNICYLNLSQQDRMFYHSIQIDPEVSIIPSQKRVEVLAVYRDPESGNWFASVKDLYPDWLNDKEKEILLQKYVAHMAHAHPLAAMADILVDDRKYTVLLDVYLEEDGSESYDIINAYQSHPSNQNGDCLDMFESDDMPSYYSSIESIHYLIPNPDGHGWMLADQPIVELDAICNFHSCGFALRSGNWPMNLTNRWSDDLQIAIVNNVFHIGFINDNIPAIELGNMESIGLLNLTHLPAIIEEANQINAEALKRIKNLVKKGRIQIMGN